MELAQHDINLIILLLIAMMNAYTAYMTRRVEKNTNSMKDALVASTALASHAAGLAEGKLELSKNGEPTKVEITNIPNGLSDKEK